MGDHNATRLKSLRDQLIRVYEGQNWVTDGMMQRLSGINPEFVQEPFPYFNHNLIRLYTLGFQIETFRPNAGTHEVTEAMKVAVLQALAETRAS